MNLLKETKDLIEALHQSVDDIIFIGSEASGHSCTWEEFCTLADFEYDNGFGGQNVVADLVIVFRDMTMLHREEYDGSEWWGIRSPFKMPKAKKPILRLNGGNSWLSLEDMNKE
jgi:hypothetical protein